MATGKCTYCQLKVAPLDHISLSMQGLGIDGCYLCLYLPCSSLACCVPVILCLLHFRLSCTSSDATCSVSMSVVQERLDQPFFVWGEDALLKWPGAVTPLIEERDAYMARVVAAAAQGSNPNVPAYVADQVMQRRRLSQMVFVER